LQVSDSILLVEADDEEEDGEETPELEEDVNSDRRTLEYGALGMFVNEQRGTVYKIFMINFIMKS
tara:strand:- start:3776 stop:3970 length:195 start_codon:yes stop_codon:yes gene_type:complete